MTNDGRTLGKLEQGMTDINKTLIRIEERMDKHSTRISNLEKGWWLLTGGLLVLSATKWPEIKALLAFGG